MKNILLIIGLLITTYTATAQAFFWEPVIWCESRRGLGNGFGLSRVGVYGGGGMNLLFTDYSDNNTLSVGGVSWHIGILAQSGPLRVDAQYWNTGIVHQQSYQLPGTASNKYQGIDLLFNIQPIQLIYVGLGVGVMAADVNGTETNQNVVSRDLQVYPTAQIGTEIPFGNVSFFLNWQSRVDFTGRYFDHYLPAQLFVGYAKADWINSLSIGIKVYGINY